MEEHHSEEGLQTACGIFGCIATGTWPSNLDISHIIYLGLVGLQHRGQESAGIVTCKGNESDKFNLHRGMGLVSSVFKEEDLVQLKGNLGIGHTRYSTAGGSNAQNIQPFVVHNVHGLLGLAHNGEIVNAQSTRKKILEKGVGLSTGSDSELLTQILCMPPPNGEPDGPDWAARIKHMMSLIPTAYALLIMIHDTIYAVRDPYGNRPLCIGTLELPSTSDDPDAKQDIDGWVVSSESCCFVSVSAKMYRELEPGEIIKLTKDGPESLGCVPRPNGEGPALCIFEYVYFARPDSFMEGQMVYGVRKECGRQLAREAPLIVDLVSTVPESATPAALGFAEELGIPYTEALCKNRYIGRTFIQPSVRLRQLAVAKKFGPLSSNFLGKRIVLIDDSIVRGTTIGAIIRILKDAGAVEVHVRIASPPLRHPCYMGINIPTKEELIANKMSTEELTKKLGAASLVYLSVDGLVQAVQKGVNPNGKPIGHCTACLTGKYPVELEF